jgi:hypothetical protein
MTDAITPLGVCTEGHACCTFNRAHDHYLTPEDCPRCKETSDA